MLQSTRGALGCAWLVGLSVALAGCSTVKTRAVEIGANPAKGLVYYLPIRSFDIDAKFIITNCEANEAGKAQLTYDVLPTVRSQIWADRQRAFVIHEGLNGRVFKALNFEIVQYENGTLKSINAVADDRTAEAATNVVSGALKFALGLTGTGLFSASSTGRTNVSSLSDLNGQKAHDDAIITKVRAACGLKVTDALVQIRQLTRSADAAAESAEAKSKLVAQAAAAEKAVVEARANLKAAKDTAGTEDLARANQSLTKAVAKAIETQQKVDDFPASTAPTALQQRVAAIVQRDLTFTVSATYVPAETDTSDDFSVALSEAKLEAAGIKATGAMTANVLFTIQFSAASKDDAGPDLKTLTLSGDQAGIWTRIPAIGAMKVCAGACAPDTIRLSQAFSVPQWGQVSVLPLQSVAFSKSTIKVNFAPDGAVTNLDFETSSPAERASGAFATMGQSVIDFTTARRTLLSNLEAAQSAAERAEIEQQIAILDLNKQLASAQDTGSVDQQRQLSDLDFQILQVGKQIELLEASKRLEALRTASAPAAQ